MPLFPWSRDAYLYIIYSAIRAMFNLGSSSKRQEVFAQAYHAGRQLGFELGYRYSNCEIGSK